MSELQATNSSIVPAGVTFSDTGVSFDRELSFDEWEGLLSYLMRMEQSVQWWLGDMLRYGESFFGENYAQAAVLVGRSVNTLANWVWISGQFPPHRRRASVRWSCYRELAAMKDPDLQDQWLDAVEEGGWTREELRQAIRHTPSSDSPPRTPPLQPTPTPSAPVEVDEDAEHPLERISWVINISVPESADLMSVQEALERSASALETVLKQLKADPEVRIAVDIST